MTLLDYQQQELEKYRLAVHTMGQDMLTLRQQVGDLQTTNSQLRRDLARQSDTTRLLLDAQELNGLSKPELAERYVSLKQDLTRYVTEMSCYKERVLKLQNELIKKNDKEKEYLRVSDAHVTQQDVLQRLQNRAAKVRRLEDAVRKQEKVIEKMEKIINSRSKGPRKEIIGESDVKKNLVSNLTLSVTRCKLKPSHIFSYRLFNLMIIRYKVHDGGNSYLGVVVAVLTCSQGRGGPRPTCVRSYELGVVHHFHHLHERTDRTLGGRGVGPDVRFSK